MASPDGRTLATGSADHTVRLWDIATGRQLAVLPQPSSVRDLAICPTEPILAATSFHNPEPGGELKLWDMRTGVELPTAPAVTSPCAALAFSPDGRILATGHSDSTILIWDFPSMQLKTQFLAGSGLVRGLAFSPDGKRLASGNTDRRVRLWNVGNWESPTILAGHTKAVYFVAFSPDSSTLASAGDDRVVRLWNPQDAAEIAVLRGPKSNITSLVFSPDGSRIAASATAQRTVFLWDTQTHEVAGTLEVPTEPSSAPKLDGIGFLPQGDQLASGYGTKLKVWNLSRESGQVTRREPPPKGNARHSFEGHTDVVRSVLFAPDGHTIASRSDDRTVRLWDTGQQELRATLRDGQWTIRCIAFSPDSTTLALGAGPRVSLWDVATGQKLAALGSHEDQNVYCLAFSPDGAILASGSGHGQNEANRSGEVKLWDVAAQRELTSLERFPGNVNDVTFSADSKLLATRQWHYAPDFSDTTVQSRLWDVESAKLHANVNMAPDTRAFLVSNQRLVELTNNAIRIRDLANGNPLGKTDLVDAVRSSTAQSDDGSTVAIHNDFTNQNTDSGTVRGVIMVDCVNITFRRVPTVSEIDILSLSPDGKLLATTSPDNVVRVWDVARGTLLSRLRGHTDRVHHIAFSPDGSIIATGSADNSVKLWSAREP